MKQKRRPGTPAALLGALLFSILFSSTGFATAQGLQGRWNITEESGAHRFSSWLEVTQAGSGWKGRFLHRGGHALAAGVTVRGDDFSVTMIPEGASARRPDRRAARLEGRLQNGKLSGTGTDRRGNYFKWTAVRAPDRLAGSNRKVEWQKPIELFDGKSLNGWKTIGGSRPSKWKAVNGVLVNQDTGANLRTAEEFRDFRLHVEFKIPKGSNSGVYLRGRYETQVADSYGQPPHSRGVGGIYGLVTPTVNASHPAGEWNVLEATIVGYRVTIVVNGQTTIDAKLVDGITGGALDVNETAPGPIMLQGDHGAVYYRNIILTPAR